MQASERVLAWRYGRALFEAAGGNQEKVQQELQAAHGAARELLPVLKDPRVPAAEKRRKLEAVLSREVSALTRRFLELLIDKKRLEILPMVIADFGRLLARKRNVAKAQVRTARPLSEQDQRALREKLKNFAGKTIELDVKEDPEILGGVVVRLGDWVLDSSLRGRLRQLRETINGD
ncbi:MAG: ATP synthase F1 subunit delta [Elusimicrobia bacterium]|nr:ATP synthase F1 subunit delta [Elusimicrobiota bacterium]MDE2426729.1 ATP synthase F1 subunit delta [Elusimicrobiota bacterium]